MREKFIALFKKLVNRETILYAVFGVLTSVQNVFMFKGLLLLGMDYRVGNIITLIVVKLTAYILNKNIVFNSHCSSFGKLMLEVLRFVFARGATALIDYFGLILLVEVLGFDKFICKIFVTILVIVINYVVGKKHVFKKETQVKDEGVQDIATRDASDEESVL